MRIVIFALGASNFFALEVPAATEILLASAAKHALELVWLAYVQRGHHGGWETT